MFWDGWQHGCARMCGRRNKVQFINLLARLGIIVFCVLFAVGTIYLIFTPKPYMDYIFLFVVIGGATIFVGYFLYLGCKSFFNFVSEPIIEIIQNERKIK